MTKITKNDNNIKSKKENIETHTKNNLFKCPENGCKYKSKLRTNLNRHIQTHRRDNLLKCPENYCEYKCIQKVNLNIHIKNRHKRNLTIIN